MAYCTMITENEGSAKCIQADAKSLTAFGPGDDQRWSMDEALFFLGPTMKKLNPISKDLIAPCGMNCAICSRYLSHVNNLNRCQCIGCRPGNKRCSYLFDKCFGINSTLKGNAAASFCFECDQYPCKQINRMDNRYKSNYEMSVKDNLECIKKIGVDKFTKAQYEKYRCSKCGGLISIHNRKCFRCDTIGRLVEKRNKKY